MPRPTQEIDVGASGVGFMQIIARGKEEFEVIKEGQNASAASQTQLMRPLSRLSSQ